MKLQKIITIITIILLILVITVASLLGINKREEFRVVNKIPKYILGMEFTKTRVVDLEVNKDEENEEETEETSEEEKENKKDKEKEEENKNEEQNDNIYTKENYKLVKKIIKYRLKKLGVDQYKLNLDYSNGNINLRIPDNDDTDSIIDSILQSGTFELKDNETDEVLLDTSLINNVKVVYGQDDSETGVYVQISFNKEGSNKLNEISKVYVEMPKEETSDETKEDKKDEEEDEEDDNIKKSCHLFKWPKS